MATLDLTALTDDDLRDEVATWAARVAAGEARLIALIGELETRGAWGGVGVLSCAHWLAWRCGMGLGAARERVRVAVALRDLPRIAAGFAEGRLTWTQVRAITRVCTAGDEQTWVDLASDCSGAQIERLVQAVRRSQAADEDAATVRSHPTVRTRPDGRVAVTFVLEPGEATVVLAGMERVLDEARSEVRSLPLPVAEEPELSERSEPPMPRSSGSDLFATEAELATRRAWTDACLEVAQHNRRVREQREERELARAKAAAVARLPAKPTLTDALLRMAASALDAPGPLPVAVKERLRVCVDPLSGWGRLRDGTLLAPGQIARPAGPLEPLDLTSLDKGRTMREVTLPLRRMLGQVDGERCRMPGCTRTTKLHAHHVRFWSQGGPTDLANLVLVCSRHHTLIHVEGVQLVLRADRTLEVRTSDGVHVPHRPTLRVAPADQLPAAAFTPSSGDRLDLDHAVWVLRQQAA
ncbi:MAG: endonuclease [Frankiales bacterium]|nr:endonuclease [Frankiales bacterium]